MPETCHACGKAAVSEVVGTYEVSRPGGRKAIPDRRMACSACGNVSYRGSQVSEHERAVADAAREIDGLLSPGEMRALRERYGLRQADMEAILSTGPKTWTRWERGRVVHGRVVDRYLRALSRDPFLARREMRAAGVANPDAEAAFDRIEADVRERVRAAAAGVAAEEDGLTVSLPLSEFADLAAGRPITFGEALDAAGFRPPSARPARAIRQGRKRQPLVRWNDPAATGQDPRDR